MRTHPVAPARPSAEARAAWPGVVPPERDACGIGFVARLSGPPCHEIVERGMTALQRLAHRGGMDADGRSGDGAGVLLQIPRAIFGDHAVAVLFDWDERARGILEHALEQEQVPLTAWREVPVDPDSLGAYARSTMPTIWHGLIAPAGFSPLDFEHRLYVARRRAELMAEARGVRMYVPSCSSRTIVYKGLMAGPWLRHFYLDLDDPRCESQLAVFHQRFSTNTMPDWRNAQPFRMLAHNGEINTWDGNKAWMRAREPELPEELRKVCWAEGSDSANLDNVLELLVQRGWQPASAIMTLVPDVWEGRADMSPRVRDFYRYQSTHFEPWDGPAGLVFSDGRIAGAALDRNGLRPLRYQVTDDGLVFAASEVGVIEVDQSTVKERGRLGPGQILLVDVVEGEIRRDAEAKAWVASMYDYGELADRALRPVDRTFAEITVPPDLGPLQRMHGWGAEDVKMVVQTMATSGHELVYSMGDDTPIAGLGRTDLRVYGYLRQKFAQVTNPAIDPLRERSVMSLRTLLGTRGRSLIDVKDLPLARARVHPASATPAEPLLELSSPFISAGELPRILESATLLDATFAIDETLAGAIARLCDEAETAPGGVIALSDQRAGEHRLAVPMPLAVGAVHERLLARGTRMHKGLIAIAGDCVDTHDLAVLIGCGAAAVHPYLGIATARVQAEAEAREKNGSAIDGEQRYRAGLEEGLLKIMSKMGISCVASYQGAHIFEAIGLGAEVMRVCMPTVPSRIGGVGFADLEARIRQWHHAAWHEGGSLPDLGRIRFRKNGEFHAHNPIAVRQLQKAADTGDRAEFEKYRQLASMGRPSTLREFMAFREVAPSIDLDAVEPVESIQTRFVSTAMSLGALSPEAHETLAVAMNRIGARSNSGEGGEDPSFYAPRPPGADRSDNRIKQVASARFGVTPEYLKRADEIEIKIAQGSKPGEGGQLPGLKVTELIARLRHAQPGQPLISPPPHHDIYSIEDLAQLIHDLKAVNPRARIGVKLVSEAGVGTIAAGVVKARADYVLVSGHDGGTGASPLSSIKNAGIPWELGLAETQQALVSQRLRERVSLRTDGGLRTGRDIVVAALLGAEEFGFGTGLLVAIGCDMARQCHLNTCPTGIATQRPDLRAKFTGRPEQVINYLGLIAAEVREILARLGARSLDEVIGRVELLEQVADCPYDLSFVLRPPSDPDAPRRRLWPRNGDPAPPSPPSGRILNSHRTVGADLQDECRSYVGAAGQSFGAFLAPGTRLDLEGEANDYVGKGMGGGVIAIRPYRENTDPRPVLAGNTCLYGATGGRLYIAGRVGERFCVRNSGAIAVVEGAGDHFCEYMTGGKAVALGPVGWNVGAGMTGGVAYVREFRRINDDSVAIRPVPPEDAADLRALVEEHHRNTGSWLAGALLADWDSALRGFRQVVPIGRYEAERPAVRVISEAITEPTSSPAG